MISVHAHTQWRSRDSSHSLTPFCLSPHTPTHAHTKRNRDGREGEEEEGAPRTTRRGRLSLFFRFPAGRLRRSRGFFSRGRRSAGGGRRRRREEGGGGGEQQQAA